MRVIDAHTGQDVPQTTRPAWPCAHLGPHHETNTHTRLSRTTANAKAEGLHRIERVTDYRFRMTTTKTTYGQALNELRSKRSVIGQLPIPIPHCVRSEAPSDPIRPLLNDRYHFNARNRARRRRWKNGPVASSSSSDSRPQRAQSGLCFTVRLASSSR